MAALAAVFLMVHGAGAGMDYVVSYLKTFLPDVKYGETEALLLKHDHVFQSAAFPLSPSWVEREGRVIIEGRRR